LKITWKILGIKATDGLITQARYEARVTEKDLAVDTEGYWFFKNAKLVVPFDDVTEEMMVEWINAESENAIEKRLAEQLKNLAAQQEIPLPWMPQVFTPKFEE
jgi:hypothetical protein